ncbi:MAG: late competence development ComFB family protein [Hahellaceae bacterium]|nr:late competence development ComFB family protein [Hahellaceae bacterium]
MSILDNIQNYYEPLVMEELAHLLDEQEHDRPDEDMLGDVVCVALNHLPPRYFRHEVDLIYYLSPTEAEEMRAKVRKAVEDALAYVTSNRRS